VLDSGQQTARVDRLSDKIIRTRGKPILALIFIDKSSNQNNRYVRAGRTVLTRRQTSKPSISGIITSK
jgi:hypothetical protein